MLGKFITHCEDSLTAAVFTHLLHLPTEVFWKILRNACYTDTLPQYSGEPLSVEFWPNWNSEGTSNSNRVIPDLFMRFTDLDLIIEAKRGDNCMQSREQWKKEVTAYANEHGDEHVPVRMIALGGIWENHDAEVIIAGPISESGSLPTGKRQYEIKCPIQMCRWSRLVTECQRMHRELGKIKYHSTQTRAHQRILSDLLDLFTWHGFQTGTWFGDVVPKLLQLGSRVQFHHRTFQNISFQLSQP
jgi:hypothetical protein